MRTLWRILIWGIVMAGTSSCGLFKKGCDCPKWGQKPASDRPSVVYEENHS
ncbi:MAG: hypothetical protein LW707_01190 [Sphingobacteriales bacterium]|nr:hypothetical protein [Sphingobacteriales bacterium]